MHLNAIHLGASGVAPVHHHRRPRAVAVPWPGLPRCPGAALTAVAVDGEIRVDVTEIAAAHSRGSEAEPVSPSARGHLPCLARHIGRLATRRIAEAPVDLGMDLPGVVRVDGYSSQVESGAAERVRVDRIRLRGRSGASGETGCVRKLHLLVIEVRGVTRQMDVGTCLYPRCDAREHVLPFVGGRRVRSDRARDHVGKGFRRRAHELDSFGGRAGGDRVSARRHAQRMRRGGFSGRSGHGGHVEECRQADAGDDSRGDVASCGHDQGSLRLDAGIAPAAGPPKVAPLVAASRLSSTDAVCKWWRSGSP
ncbi:hypothetical protein BFL35_00765 [Clavibacter michiganensis]|nr:hypothetical protein BFL35_00765 [Clavibacter michiganensis]